MICHAGDRAVCHLAVGVDTFAQVPECAHADPFLHLRPRLGHEFLDQLDVRIGERPQEDGHVVVRRGAGVSELPARGEKEGAVAESPKLARAAMFRCGVGLYVGEREKRG
mgnify:CR=1 FL=1